MPIGNWKKRFHGNNCGKTRTIDASQFNRHEQEINDAQNFRTPY